MPDITMTQIRGATHHYRALIDVDPGNPKPTVDLFNFLDADGALKQTVDGILQDPELEANIFGRFQILSSSVQRCEFLADSLVKTFDAAGEITGATIQLDITTTAPVAEQDAIEMKFQFLHTATR